MTVESRWNLARKLEKSPLAVCSPKIPGLVLLTHQSRWATSPTVWKHSGGKAKASAPEHPQQMTARAAGRDDGAIAPWRPKGAVLEKIINSVGD